MAMVNIIGLTHCSEWYTFVTSFCVKRRRQMFAFSPPRFLSPARSLSALRFVFAGWSSGEAECIGADHASDRLGGRNKQQQQLRQRGMMESVRAGTPRNACI